MLLLRSPRTLSFIVTHSGGLWWCCVTATGSASQNFSISYEPLRFWDIGIPQYHSTTPNWTPPNNSWPYTVRMSIKHSIEHDVSRLACSPLADDYMAQCSRIERPDLPLSCPWQTNNNWSYANMSCMDDSPIDIACIYISSKYRWGFQQARYNFGYTSNVPASLYWWSKLLAHPLRTCFHEMIQGTNKRSACRSDVMYSLLARVSNEQRSIIHVTVSEAGRHLLTIENEEVLYTWSILWRKSFAYRLVTRSFDQWDGQSIAHTHESKRFGRMRRTAVVAAKERVPSGGG